MQSTLRSLIYNSLCVNYYLYDFFLLNVLVRRVRGEILEVLELPFKYPELFFPGCPRRQGVLLYGPPGNFNYNVHELI